MSSHKIKVTIPAVPNDYVSLSLAYSVTIQMTSMVIVTQIVADNTKNLFLVVWH